MKARGVDESTIRCYTTFHLLRGIFSQQIQARTNVGFFFVHGDRVKQDLKAGRNFSAHRLPPSMPNVLRPKNLIPTMSGSISILGHVLVKRMARRHGNGTS